MPAKTTILHGIADYMILQELGTKPTGARLKRITESPNYKAGSFQNELPTEVMLNTASYWGMLRKFLNKPKTTVPPVPISSVRTELGSLRADEPILVWFGHSSYLIRWQDKTILVDPVFSGNASPVSFFAKAFPGADAFSAVDLGAIDLLIITHDHYDHLDYRTICALRPRIKQVCTSLGVGAHLESWGVPAGQIQELDWWEACKPLAGVDLIATPARHFSGRGIKRNQTLWSSFVLKLEGHKLYLGGDSGYGPHFAAVGNKYGPFDMAILEAGQYGDDWPYIHMRPEECVTAAIDLKASVLLPVHWAKFSLAMHEWNEPIMRVVTAAEKQKLQVTTPRIGEPVILNQSYPREAWWR